jgi:hypothetical protein
MTSNRGYYIRMAALILGLSMLPHSLRSQAIPKCRPADATSARVISALTAWVTTTDPERISQRDNIFHVPVVPVSQITLVTDERICSKVAAAYASFPRFAYTPARLYVIKMGNKNYVGYDPDKRGGEFTAVHVFDQKYVSVGGWSG